MKRNITVLPLHGVEFDGKTVSFGQSREAVEPVLGPAQKEHRSRAYYCGGELAIDFDSADKVNFIEFLGGAQGELVPELYGLPVFETDADQVLELLKENGGEIVDEDGGYTVTVPTLSVGLYREITPADVEEMVRQMANMDVTHLGHVDLAAEQRRAGRWETIGIGSENYYA